MLLLAALAPAFVPAPQARPQAQATARIVHAVRVTKEEWERLPRSRSRETVVVEGGRQRPIRLIEFE
jgi:hypothetical protein